ncbi:2-oxoacid:acceptor oxidoreductase family protein [Caldanaerobius polysaccharolyticus]|uniref:2-oxoacid:acceptor oxidoreductase family protein n=1 Tax=Caldanaerobius polysaccharolyticus TaxID=44256 RepID=UPI00047AAE1E|nr:2-oxoacid:acceptor oxidoreductase family protein [Caldanaerobius polysaccharolyticus]
MEQRVIMAGFGGQGIMSMGQLLAYAGMLEGKKVSWLPSYGPEQRGGTANCHVVVTDGDPGSPLVTEATSVIAMNRPSLEKFQRNLIKGGLLIVNSSLVDVKPDRTDVNVVYIKANDIANELGDLRVANMVALGAFIKQTGVVKFESAFSALRKVMEGRKAVYIPQNIQALKQGALSLSTI